MNRSMIGVFAGIFLVGLVLIQLVPVPGMTNPPVTADVAWDSPRTEALVRAACFDCHSNETEWPWYSNLAPVSWMLVDHVQEGREKLNFSTGWEVQYGGRMVEAVQEGGMPPFYYVPLHPASRLNEADRADLIAGLRATFGSSEFGDDEGEAHEEEDEAHENEGGVHDD